MNFYFIKFKLVYSFGSFSLKLKQGSRALHFTVLAPIYWIRLPLQMSCHFYPCILSRISFGSREITNIFLNLNRDRGKNWNIDYTATMVIKINSGVECPLISMGQPNSTYKCKLFLETLNYERVALSPMF